MPSLPMTNETLLRLLRLALRLVDVLLSRRPARALAPTRADKVVERVAPVAEKMLDVIVPDGGRGRGSGRRRPQRASSRRLPLVLAAVAGGSAAYCVVRRWRTVRQRYVPRRHVFPQELLDILAAPGGGERLHYADGRLTDPVTAVQYPVIDGIPDFCQPASRAVSLPQLGGAGWLIEPLAPVADMMLGVDHLADAVLAGAVAASVLPSGGWLASVPCGAGAYELAMALACPAARIVCVSADWNALLETRRRALAAGIDNVYCVRGEFDRLPLKTAAVHGLWTANGFHDCARPEAAMAQIVRVVKPNVPVAGVLFAVGNARLAAWLAHLTRERLRGLRTESMYCALLTASGLSGVRAVRRGVSLRFWSVSG